MPGRSGTDVVGFVSMSVRKFFSTYAIVLCLSACSPNTERQKMPVGKIEISMAEQNEVQKLVIDFFDEYIDWYKFAYDYSVKHPDRQNNNDTTLERRYDALIKKYCVPGKKRQGLAFGSAWPKQKIAKFETTPTGAIVHTLQSDFDDDYWTKHEYHLIEISEKWYIDEIYYIDGNKKYPSL